MVSSNSSLLFLALASAITPTAADLAWGTFLGADWRNGEERLRKNVSASIKNSQTICSKDVQNICLGEGKYASGDIKAVTGWTANYERKQYKHFEEVSFGFGDTADQCLHDEFDKYESGSSKRLAPKCVEWLETSEGNFEKLMKREKGNDKREAFVIFATLFATLVSLAVGYMYGIFMRDRDEILGYGHGRQNKRVLIFFGVVISIPALVILWACPKMFMLMGGGFIVGRVTQIFYERKYGGNPYSSVLGSDSGLVFAAIPVQMD